MTFALSFFRPQKQMFFYPKTLFWALFSVFWNWKMEKCAIKGGREGRDLTPNGTSHELFPLFGALPSLIYWTSDVLKTWQMWPWLTRILSTSQSSSKVYVGIKHHWCLNFGQDFEAEFCRDSELNFDRDQCENLWYNLKAVILVKALNPWICSDFGNASIDDYIAVGDCLEEILKNTLQWIKIFKQNLFRARSPTPPRPAFCPPPYPTSPSPRFLSRLCYVWKIINEYGLMYFLFVFVFTIDCIF